MEMSVVVDKYGIFDMAIESGLLGAEYQLAQGDE
jgi:hypothetical protein